MAGLGSVTNSALNQLSLTQGLLSKTYTELSTGKAINSAADNPSGLAIYENLTAQANGFDQGSLNAQDALNATNVAQGATQSISDILQNVNVLAIQASNSFLSPTDAQAIQAQANQEIQQVNTIAGDTNFNGVNLSSGQFAGTVAATPATANVTSNDLLQTAPGNVINTAAGVTVNPGTPSESVQISVSAGQAQVNVVDSATGTITNVGSFAAGSAVSAGGVNFTLGNFGATDTGTATIAVNPGTTFSAGNPATVQTGATQGATTQLSFPSVTSQSLGISNLSFATVANSENSIGVVSQAIDQLATSQGQLGAQTNALQEQIGQNNIASTNLTASASNIGDANFANVASQNNLETLQSKITLTVLNQANVNAGFLSALFNHAA